MFGFASTENEPLVRILTLASVKPLEVSKGYPPCDADKVFDFDVAVDLLNRRIIDLIVQWLLIMTVSTSCDRTVNQ